MTLSSAKEALLPYPFCGGEPERCENTDPALGGLRPMYWVLCRSCHASPGDRKTEAEAISAWNTRAQPEAGLLAKSDEKNAKLTLKLRADSGYCCDMDARVSANQWAEICKIIDAERGQ